MNEHSHIVRSYDEEQAALMRELLRMGEMSVAQLEAALDVVDRRDDKAAERVMANDDAIDALEQQVSQDVIRLIRRGPIRQHAMMMAPVPWLKDGIIPGAPCRGSMYPFAPSSPKRYCHGCTSRPNPGLYFLRRRERCCITS